MASIDLVHPEGNEEPFEPPTPEGLCPVPPGGPRTIDTQPPGRGHETSVADAFFTALAHASGDIDHDLPVLLQVVAECLGFDVATMWWWKAEEGLLRCEHVWQTPAADCGAFLELALRSALAPGEPVPGVVFRDGQPVWVPDVKSYPNFRRGPAASAAGLRSGVAFPIRARNDAVGVFELFTLEQRDLNAPLLDAVAKAAAHLGDFIERLNVHAERDRLLGELHAAHRRQRFLLDANRALSTTRGLGETIDKLARVAVPAIGDLCLIDVVTKTGGIERLSAYHADQSVHRLVDELRRFPPEPDGDHPAAIAIRSGISHVAASMPRPFLASTTRSERHYELTRQLHFTSYVSAPLLSADRPVGALTVVSAGSGRHFGQEELQLVEELAGQVTSVIERERRFDEQHHVAHILQRSMLPAAVDAPEGLQVSARYVASGEDTEIGGDFYDVVRLGASRVALVVGDVQGHDLTAITVMAKVRHALRAFLQIMHSLDDILQAVDRFVTEQPEQRFVTLALAILDVTTGDLELALAGHPAPLQLGDTVEPLHCNPGPPAGTGHRGRHRPYQTTRSHLPVGTGLVFYTDGLSEARQGGPEARLPLLLEALDRHRNAPLEQACDAIIEETLAGITPSDDVALLWAVRTGDAVRTA
jgi:serine phosphatase RsbU (regulator of sigma subunit)